MLLEEVETLHNIKQSYTKKKGTGIVLLLEEVETLHNIKQSNNHAQEMK